MDFRSQYSSIFYFIHLIHTINHSVGPIKKKRINKKKVFAFLTQFFPEFEQATCPKMRGEERRRRKGAESCGGARALQLALLICNQTLSLSSFLPSLQTMWMAAETKLAFSAAQRLLLVLFQATALIHRPFCMEHTKTAARERERE